MIGEGAGEARYFPRALADFSVGWLLRRLSIEVHAREISLPSTILVSQDCFQHISRLKSNCSRVEARSHSCRGCQILTLWSQPSLIHLHKLRMLPMSMGGLAKRRTCSGFRHLYVSIGCRPRVLASLSHKAGWAQVDRSRCAWNVLLIVEI